MRIWLMNFKTAADIGAFAGPGRGKKLTSGRRSLSRASLHSAARLE